MVIDMRTISTRTALCLCLAIGGVHSRPALGQPTSDQLKEQVDALKTENAALKKQLGKLKTQNQELIERERRATYAQRIALAHREWRADNVTGTRQLLDQCPPNLRRWEWLYFGRQMNENGPVFSPDGKRIGSEARKPQ